MNNTKNVIELSNIEIHEHCILNVRTGEKTYNTGKKEIPYFTGLYYKDKNTFFALYPSVAGPIMYYKGEQYLLTPDLHIHLNKMGDSREFVIEEYHIDIRYRTSKYIGFDVWSTEKDVDLFYQIAHFYKQNDYYEKFTERLQ